MNRAVQISYANPFSKTEWDLHYPYSLKRYHFTFKTPQQASHVAAHIVLLTELDNPHLELGLNEIFLNAIEHGNLGVSNIEKFTYKNTADWQNIINNKLKEPENLKKEVRVTVEITPIYTCFQVEDEGEGFNSLSKYFKQPSQLVRHGRGILLASTLCFDKVEFIGKGNIVHCICWKK